jgi:hypothetical protein
MGTYSTMLASGAFVVFRSGIDASARETSPSLTSNGELKQSKGFGKTGEILRLGVYALLVMLSLAVPIVFPVLVLSLNTVVQDPVLLPHTA